MSDKVTKLYKEIEVEMPLRVKVRITDEIKNGMRDGYGYTEEELSNDELVAKAIAYAALSPILTDFQLDAITADYVWKNVGNIRGLIRNVELENE